MLFAHLVSPYIFIGMLGTWIGKKILNYIPQDRFKRLSLFFVLLIGLVTIVKILIDQYT